MTDELNTPLRQLRFTLTREDIAAFELLPRELIGLEKLWLFGPILVCGALVGLFQDNLKPFFPWDPETQLGQVLSVLAAVAVGYVLSLIALTARARTRIARTPLPLEPVAVDVFEDRISVSADGASPTMPWRDVTVSSTASHVFLSTAPREALILPERAFADAADMRAFALWAKDQAMNAEYVAKAPDRTA